MYCKVFFSGPLKWPIEMLRPSGIFKRPTLQFRENSGKVRHVSR